MQAKAKGQRYGPRAHVLREVRVRRRRDAGGTVCVPPGTQQAALFARVVTYLDRKGFEVRELEPGAHLVTWTAGDHVVICIEVSVVGSTIVFRAGADLIVPESHVAAVGELVLRSNDGRSVGGLDFSFATRELSSRVAVTCPDRLPTDAALEEWLGCAASCLDSHYPALAAVSQGRQSVLEAIARLDARAEA